MKKLSILFLVISILTVTCQAEIGDIWDLGSDFQNTTNPGPWIDPGTLGGGLGQWSYIHSSGILFNLQVNSNPAAECNLELPNCGIGWTIAPDGSHICLIKFCSGGGSKTNYVNGDIGGHASIGAVWETDHAGWFRIDYSGYNTRISATCQANECGRSTDLQLTGPAGVIASRAITGGIEEGSANAYTNTRYVQLLAGESVTLQQLGDDWCGLTMTVTEVDESEVPEPTPVDWTEFSAEGYSIPVTGVVYDEDYRRPVSGMPIGGIDTGCFDIETTGLIGYSSIFNHLDPRGGPVNIPLFGFSVGGQTWVLTNGITKVYDNGTNHRTFTSGTPLSFPGCHMIKGMKYWGHYPILDMSFEYNNPQPPVDVSIRAWCPFIPGDTPISNTPGSVFEVKIENTSGNPQSGSFVFNFPRFSSHASKLDIAAEPAESVTRQYLNTDIKGVMVADAGRKMSYVLAVMDESTTPRVGGELDVDAAAWSNIETSLPTVAADNAGSAVAVDFNLAGGESKTIRYLFTWYAPDWNGSGNPFDGGVSGSGGRACDSYILENGIWGNGSGVDTIVTGMNFASNPRSNPVGYNVSFPVTTGQPVALYFTKSAGEDFDDFCAGNMTVEILDGPLAGQTWDLKANWSDGQNPQGQWEYGGAGGGGWDLLNVQQSDWLPADLHYPDAQFAWSDTAEGVPGWAKCVNDNPYGKDIITDDVFCHGPASARWISPANCTIRVTGQVWMVRDITAPATHTFTHMYAARYSDAISVADLLAQRHQELLARIISWQEAIFKDANTPGWLADSLINILHLITETSVWGQIKAPISPAFNVADGLFGMNECPRGCSQIECIPCSFYGNIPLNYFFPDTALSTLRGYKNYQAVSGRPPWIFGGRCTGSSGGWEIAAPEQGYQQVLNGPCYVIMADRYWRVTGDDAFLVEFWDSIKACTDWSFNLRPAYGLSQIMAMPTDNAGTEWFEAPEPGWRGYVTHAGGVRMAHCMIVKKMAEYLGDTVYEAKCDTWLNAGWNALETHLWNDQLGFYRNYNEPETGQVSNFLFGYQLDGEWIADWHGVPSVFPKSRVDPVLDKIRNINCVLSQSGAVNYANGDGTPAQVAGYGPYSYFPPELMMLSMNYMYEGQKTFGMELLQRCMENIAVTWGYTWDSPNIMRGDTDTGERVFGADYYQDMMLWAVPAATHAQNLVGPSQPGGLVNAVIKAGNCINPTASFDENCWVDHADLFLMAQQWLSPSPAVGMDIAPPGGDGKIDMKDYSALAEQWLDCGLYDLFACFN